MSVSIGIDIAKEKMDVYGGGSYAQIKNTEGAIKAHFNPMDRESRIVMEATGKYHRLPHRVLEGMGFQVMVVNPYQSKHFANALNLLCKTDKVDAKMLCLFGEKMDFKATVCASKVQESLLDLSRHLDDLKQLKVDLDLRSRDTRGFIKGSLEKAIKAVAKQIKETEKELRRTVDADEKLEKKLMLLESIPGIGVPTAMSLLSYLSELGQVNKRQIASLSGLAPVNNESGMFRGKRRIRGGRHDVRTHLYMRILGAATQHNERLKRFYTRLVNSGKPKKVALTACMRKLVVWANAILMSEQPWDNNYAKNC